MGKSLKAKRVVKKSAPKAKRIAKPKGGTADKRGGYLHI